jgi:hypothetical protein
MTVTVTVSTVALVDSLSAPVSGSASARPMECPNGSASARLGPSRQATASGPGLGVSLVFAEAEL